VSSFFFLSSFVWKRTPPSGHSLITTANSMMSDRNESPFLWAMVTTGIHKSIFESFELKRITRVLQHSEMENKAKEFYPWRRNDFKF
jgi:hypothetical protein